MTKAGIHADGLLKEEEIYNVFDTMAILNRPPEVAITDRAGLAGLAYWYNTQLPKLKDAKDKLDKSDDALLKIKEEIDQMFKDGRSTSMSHEEIRELAAKYLSKYV